MPARYGDAELLFYAVSKSGMTMMQKKRMKTAGNEDAQMFFHADSAAELATRVGGGAKVLSGESFYQHIGKKGLKFSTKVSMVVSDWLGMVIMAHLSI